MARRAGVRAMPLSAAGEVLRTQRADTRDIYAPLSSLRIDIGDPLQAPEKRFRLVRRTNGGDQVLRLMPTALSQLCSTSGVPLQFVERAPAPLAAKALRCFLEMADEANEKPSLLRLKGVGSPKVRAILPQAYVRLDDLEVFAEVSSIAGEAGATVTNLHADEDFFTLRLIQGEALNLGTPTKPDVAYSGIDIITSETGCHPLEVRCVLVRVVCQNGLTHVSSAQEALRTRYTRMDRDTFRSVLRSTLEEVVRDGKGIASRLAESRTKSIEDPVQEIERIFYHFRLGSPRGRVGRWVTADAMQKLSLWGVQRFDIVQAFTRIAQSLDHRERRRLEDAMGLYLIHGLRKPPKNGRGAEARDAARASSA